MGFLDWLRGRSKDAQIVDQASDSKNFQSLEKCQSPQLVNNSEKYITFVKTPRFKKLKVSSTNPSSNLSLDNFFTSGKINNKLPGFVFRSKNKVKLLSYDLNSLNLGVGSSIVAFDQENGTQFIINEPTLKRATVSDANRYGAILRSDNIVGYMEFKSATLHLFQFDWQPFRTAVNDNNWFVGTRETTEGPGELYCFSLSGDYLWGLQFTEQFNTIFGLIKATPYHLSTVRDSTDIMVSTMDRFYRISQEGTLLTRIAISDLRKADIKEKELKRRADLPKNPKTKEEMIQVLTTEMAEQFISGIERASMNSPFAGYTYDPQADILFILEADGRLTAWDVSGDLLWTQSFHESGHFISLLEDLVIISFRSGNTFWIDQDGAIRYSVKIPAQAVSITPIPESEKYLVICDNSRRYEFDRSTGEIAEGPEGNRNMQLFQYQNRLFFYDGYLWAAPSGQEWRTFETKLTENAINISDLPIDSSPPQIKADKPFEDLWCYNDPDTRGFDFFALDKKNKRIYIGRPKSSLTSQEKKQEEASRENSFAYWHEILCYDSALNQIWSKAYLSELTCLAVSPEGDAVFVGLWRNGLSYDPADLVVLNSEGKEYARFATLANPISIVFDTPESGVFTDYNKAQTILKRLKPGEWIPLDTVGTGDVHQKKKYGAGLDQIIQGDFSLERTGKKSYQVTCQQTAFDLKFNAAVYEAIAVPGSNNLLLRVGNKNILVISPNGEIVWKLKVKNNIKEIVPDGKGYLLLKKNDIVYVSEAGNIVWKAGCPPNAISNKAFWLQSHNAYLWCAGDSYNFQVTLITPQGLVKRSQIFEGVQVGYGQEIGAADDFFIVPVGRAKICCFKI